MGENIFIRKIEVERLHGHNNIAADLRDGLNIVYGKNGAGKTTLLHILANLLERDFYNFLSIYFDKIRVLISSGDTIELVQTKDPSNKPYAIQGYINGKLGGTISRTRKEENLYYINCNNISYKDNCMEDLPDITNNDLYNTLDKLLGNYPVYLPAFRLILYATGPAAKNMKNLRNEINEELIYRQLERKESKRLSRLKHHMRGYRSHEIAAQIANKTLLCREWFGNFVPIVRYPSLQELNKNIADEIRGAQIDLAISDQEILSQVIVEVLQAVSGKMPFDSFQDVLSIYNSLQNKLEDFTDKNNEVPGYYKQIVNQLKEINPASISNKSHIPTILSVYDRAISRRLLGQQVVYSRLRQFESSVNKFLENKKLVIVDSIDRERQGSSPFIQLEDGSKHSFYILSSGERHVLTLLFSATHMSSTDGIVLLDEPELSLHVDWQRIILSELRNQAKDRQIIACTHSPEIAADHLDSYVNINATSPIFPNTLFPAEDNYSTPDIEE